jgi:hypothetical protein
LSYFIPFASKEEEKFEKLSFSKQIFAFGHFGLAGPDARAGDEAEDERLRRR